jgi:hypothetical protein
VFLAGKLVERARPHADGQGLGGFTVLVASGLPEVCHH